MNVLLAQEVQEEVPESSATALLPPWVAGAGFAHAAGPLNQPAPPRVLEKFVLNRGEDFVRRCSRELDQSLRERPRFDEYHIVVYTTM